LGAHLAAMLPSVSYTRRPAAAGQIRIADYGDLVPGHFQGYPTVFNCIGAVSGSADALDRANVRLPWQMAERARNAGARTFVHVSSFAVFGNRERIDAGSVPCPASAYGRSKLAGEDALMELATDDFAVRIVRLPMLHALDAPGKLADLVRLWLRIRLLPVPARGVLRSMMGYRLAATVLARQAGRPRSAILAAADPDPFDYRRAAAVLTRASGHAIRAIPVPGALLAPLALARPALHHSLFRSSLLAPEENEAAGDPSTLYADLADLARREAM